MLTLFVASLALADFPAAPTQTLTGIPDFGAHLAVGDFDGDGFDDLVVSATGMLSGGVAVFRGSASGLVGTPYRAYPGSGTTNRYGTSLVVADVNGDCYDDLVIGDAYGSGRFDVFHGGPFGLGPQPHTSIAGGPGAPIELDVGRAGDVNGDGYDDIGQLGGSIAGVDVYYGSHSGIQVPAGTNIDTLSLDWNAVVGPLGDLDGDGYDELCIGNPEGGVSYADGELAAFPGSATGIDPAVYTTFDGSYGAHLGKKVDGGFDIDNDGTLEALVGRPDDLAGFGQVMVLAENLGALELSTLVVSATAGDGFGTTFAWLGDTDGDGFGELAVGVPTYGGTYGPYLAGFMGQVIVFHGSATWAAPTVTEFLGPGNWSHFGSALAGPADFNGDGLGDLVIGVPGSDSVEVRMASQPLLDQDGDGHLAPADCNDTDPNVHPGASEVCDPGDVDEDCDGLADSADPDADPASWSAFYPDGDDDGVGGIGTEVTACDPPAGMAPRDDDCDDADPFRYPLAPEVCGNGVDENCDGFDPPCPTGTTTTPCGSATGAGTGTGTGTGGTTPTTTPPADTGGPVDNRPGGREKSGCGCDSGPRTPLISLFVLPLLLSRRRGRHDRGWSPSSRAPGTDSRALVREPGSPARIHRSPWTSRR